MVLGLAVKSQRDACHRSPMRELQCILHVCAGMHTTLGHLDQNTYLRADHRADMLPLSRNAYCIWGLDPVQFYNLCLRMSYGAAHATALKPNTLCNQWRDPWGMCHSLHGGRSRSAIRQYTVAKSIYTEQQCNRQRRHCAAVHGAPQI